MKVWIHQRKEINQDFLGVAARRSKGLAAVLSGSIWQNECIALFSADANQISSHRVQTVCFRMATP